MDGGDAVIQRQPSLHFRAFREAVDGHVRSVMAQQRRHVALQQTVNIGMVHDLHTDTEAWLTQLLPHWRVHFCRVFP